jgi:hypothetical protein
MDSKQAVSFFIHASCSSLQNNVNVQAYTQENHKTNESLVITGTDVIKRKDGSYAKRTIISRYPIGASETWIKEMGNFKTDHYREVIIEI